MVLLTQADRVWIRAEFQRLRLRDLGGGIVLSASIGMFIVPLLTAWLESSIRAGIASGFLIALVFREGWKHLNCPEEFTAVLPVSFWKRSLIQIVMGVLIVATPLLLITAIARMRGESDPVTQRALVIGLQLGILEGVAWCLSDWQEDLTFAIVIGALPPVIFGWNVWTRCFTVFAVAGAVFSLRSEERCELERKKRHPGSAARKFALHRGRGIVLTLWSAVLPNSAALTLLSGLISIFIYSRHLPLQEGDAPPLLMITLAIMGFWPGLVATYHLGNGWRSGDPGISDPGPFARTLPIPRRRGIFACVAFSTLIVMLQMLIVAGAWLVTDFSGEDAGPLWDGLCVILCGFSGGMICLLYTFSPLHRSGESFEQVMTIMGTLLGLTVASLLGMAVTQDIVGLTVVLVVCGALATIAIPYLDAEREV